MRSERGWGVRSLNSGKSLGISQGRFGKRNGKDALYASDTGGFPNTSKKLSSAGSSDGDGKEKVLVINIKIWKRVLTIKINEITSYLTEAGGRDLR